MKKAAVELRHIKQANKAQAAQFFDCSLPTIDTWIRKGAPVIQKGSRGVQWVIDLRQMAEWIYSTPGSTNDFDPDDLTPSDRKSWYESEVKKRDLQISDRELIPAAEVERIVATAFSALSQDIRAIPDNLERKHGISGEIAELVEDGLCDSLESIADRLSVMAPVEHE